MQIVIEISDHLYKCLQKRIELNVSSEVDQIIAKGTLLPEHHGKLLILDKNLINQHLVPFDCSNSQWLSDVGIALSTIKIIPATKEGDGE